MTAESFDALINEIHDACAALAAVTRLPAGNGTESMPPSLTAPRHATRHPDRVVEATLAAMEAACCCGGCQYTWSDGVRVARAAISTWEAGR